MNSSGWALIYNVFVGYTSTVYRESQKLFGRYKMFKLLRQVQMWCQDLILILYIVYGKRSRVQNLNMAVSKRYLRTGMPILYYVHFPVRSSRQDCTKESQPGKNNCYLCLCPILNRVAISSKVLFLVSGTFRYVKTQKRARKTLKGRKV